MKHTVKNSLLAISSAALALSLAACGERPEAVGAYSPEAGVQERAIERPGVAGAERENEGIFGERERREERPLASAEEERERRY